MENLIGDYSAIYDELLHLQKEQRLHAGEAKFTKRVGGVYNSGRTLAGSNITARGDLAESSSYLAESQVKMYEATSKLNFIYDVLEKEYDLIDSFKQTHKEVKTLHHALENYFVNSMSLKTLKPSDIQKHLVNFFGTR
jgi:hypothetical protein